jgi:uncharacterized protein YlxW (UPF0749 family)
VIRAAWGKLTLTGKRVAVVAVVVLVSLAVLWYEFGSQISAWRAGIPQAIKANDEASKGLEQALGVAGTARTDTAATLAELANTQKSVQALAQQSSALSRKAEDALAQSRAKDGTIAALQLALKQSGERRRAQAPVTTPQEAHDALAALDIRFR